MKLVQLIQEIGEANPNMAYPYELEDESENYRDQVSYEYSFETVETGDDFRKDHLVTRYAMWIEKMPYDTWKWDDEDPSTHELQYEVSFGVRTWDGKVAATDFDTETNKGELYRVMATIVKILKDRMAEDTANGQKPKTIMFYPSKTKGEGDDRRAKLYAAYAKTQLPNSTISTTGSGKGYIITLN